MYIRTHGVQVRRRTKGNAYQNNQEVSSHWKGAPSNQHETATIYPEFFSWQTPVNTSNASSAMHPAQIVYALDPIKIPTGMWVIASHHLHAAVLALWASITLTTVWSTVQPNQTRLGKSFASGRLLVTWWWAGELRVARVAAAMRQTFFICVAGFYFCYDVLR